MTEPVHLTAGETLRKLLNGMLAHIPALTTVNASVQFIFQSDKHRMDRREGRKNWRVSLLRTAAVNKRKKRKDNRFLVSSMGFIGFILTLFYMANVQPVPMLIMSNTGFLS